EFQRFRMWRERYRQTLAEMDLEDGNAAYERIHAAIGQGCLHMPFTTVVLAGFNELSPRLSGLLDAMRKQNIEVLALDTTAAPADTVLRFAAADPDNEWRMAARWASDKLSQDPDGHYAIVAAR